MENDKNDEYLLRELDPNVNVDVVAILNYTDIDICAKIMGNSGAVDRGIVVDQVNFNCESLCENNIVNTNCKAECPICNSVFDHCFTFEKRDHRSFKFFDKNLWSSNMTLRKVKKELSLLD